MGTLSAQSPPLKTVHDQCYRRKFEDSEEDDESDDESVDSGSNFAVATIADSQQDTNTKKKNKRYTNEKGEEWGESQQKKDIIAAYLDLDSGIHKLTIPQIFELYAADHGWLKQNTSQNIRTIKKQYDEKKGPFSEKEVNTPATSFTLNMCKNRIVFVALHHSSIDTDTVNNDNV